MNKDFKFKYCYKITLTQGSLKDKIYFGQHCTNNLDDGYKGRGRILIDYYKTYPEGYIKEILGFYDTIEELDKAEYELIHPHLGQDYCLNLIEGGHVNRMSQKLKKEISIKTKEAMKDPQIRKKCSYWKDHEYPEEAGNKISTKLLDYFKTHPGNNTGKKLWPNGRTFSEEWYKNHREAIDKPEYREGLRERSKAMWANMSSEERKLRGQKIKEGHARKKLAKNNATI